jgi:Sulfate permease family
MMALLVALIEITLGVARLGVIADLLSKEVQVGFVKGLAITIVVSQAAEAVRLLGLGAANLGVGDVPGLRGVVEWPGGSCSSARRSPTSTSQPQTCSTASTPS